MRAGRLIVASGIGAVLLSVTLAVAGQDKKGAGPPAVAARPWPPARLADGQPDIQGLWSAVNAGSVSLTNPVSVAVDFDRLATGKDVRMPSRSHQSSRRPASLSAMGSLEARRASCRVQTTDETRAHRPATPMHDFRRPTAVYHCAAVQDYSASRLGRVHLG